MSRAVRVATLIYAGSILLSRVIGLVRETVIGRILGDRPEADVYWVAFILPDFLNYLLAGGALALVLIPLLQSASQRGGDAEKWITFWRISAPVSLLTISLTIILWIFTPQITPHISPGFNADQLTLLNRLTRIIIPAQIFHVCGALISSTLQADDRHIAPALAPIMYTGSIIAGGLILGRSLGAEGFAWGVLIGSALGPFICPLFAALRNGLRFAPRWEPFHPELRRYLWRALPVMLGFSVVMLDELLVKRMATSFTSGVVSQLHYARTLMRVPMGVFGLAMGMAAFPTLSRLVAQGKEREAFTLLRQATEVLLILVGASQVVLTLSASEFASLIWGSQNLSGSGAQGIGLYCATLCMGLWAWSAQGLIARGFYARGQTWLPTLTGSITLLFCLPLYTYAQQEPLWINKLCASFEINYHAGLGLALASSVAISVYVVVLWSTLAHVTGGGLRQTAGLMITLIRVGLAVVIAVYLTTLIWPRPPTSTALGDLVISSGVRSAMGGAIFILSGLMLRLKSITTLVQHVRNRLKGDVASKISQ